MISLETVKFGMNSGSQPNILVIDVWSFGMGTTYMYIEMELK